MELTRTYTFIFVFDTIFSIIVTNLVVLFWRIIWDLQDLYLNESNAEINSLISIAIFYVLILFVKLIQFNWVSQPIDLEHKNEKKNKKTLIHKVKTKLFILVFAFANINHWRGIWYLTGYYTSDSMIGVLTIGLLSLLSLIALKRVCVLISVPFVLNKDSKQAAYQLHASTFKDVDYLNLEENLHQKPTKLLLIFNFILEYLSDIFTIQMWRSLWLTCDKYLLPDNKTVSALICLATGLIIYVILHIFNRKIKIFILNTTKKPKYVIMNINQQPYSSAPSIIKLYDVKSLNELKEDNLSAFINRLFLNLIFLLGFIGTVTLWRGLWMLQLDYMYPILIQNSNVKNTILLNSIYMILVIILLWSINLISGLLARANCEDCYFLDRRNYVLKQNNFKTFFYNKNRGDVKQKLALNDSKHKWKKLLQYYLLCNYCSKSDANKIRDFIQKPNNSNKNNKQNEQEMIEKKKLTLDV